MSYNDFESISRNQFREIFQPSRIVLGVVNDETNKRDNIIALAFNMYTSYSPLMYAIAVQDINYSYQLFKGCKEYVISVPGEKLYKETLFCGTKSGRDVDKFSETKLTALPSQKIKTAGIKECIANMECIKKNFIETGDHAIVIGEVVNITRNTNNNERNIISISSDTRGYDMYVHKGMHRLGTVKV